ncbi:hypothetical protein H6P81_016339 [Aristolochia fimbriata]|uniref:Uncharacterized protein n=1 Tax=Aristolochia fimbriata TaxID=158543 RepID=A0AAV7E9Q2_ARIFI|nr:hypothetical protein H6P81_016339 [Aristolochia fimbriata]
MYNSLAPRSFASTMSSVTKTSYNFFFSFFTTYLVFLLLAPSTHLQVAAGAIGVCYGRVSNNLPSAREVIEMYKSNGIGKLRLYAPSQDALDALRGTNIEVLVDVPNEDLPQLSSSFSAAAAWVDANIAKFWPDVRLKYIAVGNEQLPSGNAPFVLGAMQNIQRALQSSGSANAIKVSTAVSMAALKSSYPPSQGAFADDLVTYLGPIARFLSSTGAPFLVNVYPYFSYIGDPSHIALSYALFTAPSDVVRDGPYGYQNLFDAMIDAVYAALDKVGASGVEVVVSESGWPSDGNVAATLENAKTYNQNLINHVRKGTPRKQVPIEAFLFAMFNENQKPGAATERNFGLFYPNKQPVYPIQFS